MVHVCTTPSQSMLILHDTIENLLIPIYFGLEALLGIFIIIRVFSMLIDYDVYGSNHSINSKELLNYRVKCVTLDEIMLPK